MSIIKKIIHVSDIHIRNFQRFEEYTEQLLSFIEKCKKICDGYSSDEIRIVICGDLFQSKNTISPELFSFSSTFIRQLEEIATVYVIAGNHDIAENNLSRKDAITALFETASFNNTYLLDRELDYHSGCIVDNNVTWALYSIYDNFLPPNIIETKIANGDNTIIGLYHGMIVGSKMDNGTVSDSGLSTDEFVDCDFVMCGHIHKFQELKKNGVPIVYSSSLIQQNFGETITQHGFCVWDVETKKYEFIDVETNYGLYDIEINSIDDIDEDKEILLNL